MKKLTGRIPIFEIVVLKLYLNLFSKMFNAGLSLSVKNKPDEMSSCRVIKTVFNLNFRDESTVPILAGGILASGFVVLIVIILYVKRRKISRWKSDLIFCLNYLSCQAHCFVFINKQRN